VDIKMEAKEIDEEMEIELLKSGVRSAEWVEKRFDELAKKFEGMLIAVEDEKIVASSDNVRDLIAQIEKEGKDPARVYVTSFPPKDFIFIL
jgi:leucyl-tRNA synthetase